MIYSKHFQLIFKKLVLEGSAASKGQGGRSGRNLRTTAPKDRRDGRRGGNERYLHMPYRSHSTRTTNVPAASVSPHLPLLTTLQGFIELISVRTQEGYGLQAETD